MGLHLQNGEPCRMPVNAARCPYCPYHVQASASGLIACDCTLCVAVRCVWHRQRGCPYCHVEVRCCKLIDAGFCQFERLSLQLNGAVCELATQRCKCKCLSLQLHGGRALTICRCFECKLADGVQQAEAHTAQRVPGQYLPYGS